MKRFAKKVTSRSGCRKQPSGKPMVGPTLGGDVYQNMCVYMKSFVTTGRNPANQLRLVIYPVIYMVLAPSEVVGNGISSINSMCYILSYCDSNGYRYCRHPNVSGGSVFTLWLGCSFRYMGDPQQVVTWGKSGVVGYCPQKNMSRTYRIIDTLFIFIYMYTYVYWYYDI